jgi:hypothetical protein
MTGRTVESRRDPSPGRYDVHQLGDLCGGLLIDGHPFTDSSRGVHNRCCGRDHQPPSQFEAARARTAPDCGASSRRGRRLVWLGLSQHGSLDRGREIRLDDLRCGVIWAQDALHVGQGRFVEGHGPV